MSALRFQPLPLVNNYLEKGAEEFPQRIAIIQHEEERALTYQQLNDLADSYSLKLVEFGLQKGDRVAGICLHSIAYTALQFACFKIGVIVCPIDIKLKVQESLGCLKNISPRLLFVMDDGCFDKYFPLVDSLKEECPSIEHIIQICLQDDCPRLPGALDGSELFTQSALKDLVHDELLVKTRDEMARKVGTKDAALIIFTTGTTSGVPKPALLHHECIIAQLEITEISKEQRGEELRMMCSLPDSHVGGTTIQPYSAIYSGGTAIMIYRFQPRVLLEAMEKWKTTWFGAIPAMYRLLWSQPDYDQFDLSSLKCVYYAGSIAGIDFIEPLSKMAPRFGTSLGMTETAGFATVTPYPITPEELAGQAGMATEIADITIREPMNADGTAGEELPLGEMGEICYHPPLVFLGYYDMPEATAESISKEGILYSGDLGSFKDMGHYKALVIRGRRKFMIKQKGYNVFPDEVVNFVNQMSEVEDSCAVGVRHAFLDEGIVVFVKPKKDVLLTAESVLKHCRDITSYKRPQHVVILAQGEAFPVNGVGKTDIVSLGKRAEVIIDALREEGLWDKDPKFSK